MQFLRQLCALGLMLWLFAGARPAAAACSADKPDITHITLHTNSGYHLRLSLHLEGDKITGKLFANPEHPGETAINGSVNGKINPDGSISLTVFLYPPAPPGTQLHIWGSLSEGGGRGEVKQTDWDPDVAKTTWIATTAASCPKWPEDLFRANLAQAAEAHADSAAAALAAASPLYACDMGSWSTTSSGSLGYEFVSECAKKIAGATPWNTGTGRGSMAWQACEVALKKRVAAIIESMRPTCEKAQRLQEAKNRCIPSHTTADGKIYQNVPSPFTNEGKDVQMCMNHVQNCFDRNATKEAQDACANRVVGCFDFGSDSRVTAAMRSFGAGGVSAIGGTKARASAANLFCLSPRNSSAEITAFIPRGKDWSILVGGSSTGLAVGNAYANLDSLVLRCAPRIAAIPAIRTGRASTSLAFADTLDPSLTAKGATRLVSLSPDVGCLPRTSPAATIPLAKLPSDGRVPPKLTNPGRGTSSSQGSSGVSLAAPGRDIPKVKPKVSTGGAGSSGSNTVSPSANSAMDRLGGGSINTVSGGAGSTGSQAGRRAPTSTPAAGESGNIKPAVGVSPGFAVDYGIRAAPKPEPFRAPR